MNKGKEVSEGSKMMYDTILAKSFSRYEQKKFGYWAFVGCLIIVLSLFTVFKPYLAPLPVLNLRLSMETGLTMLKLEDANSSQLLLGREAKQNRRPEMESFPPSPSLLALPKKEAKQNRRPETESIPPSPSPLTLPKKEAKQESKLMCNVSDQRSDFCAIDGHIMIHGNSSTILVASSQMDILPRNGSLNIRPYARKFDRTALGRVKELTVKLFSVLEEAPHCTLNHSIPAIVFSIGGYSGNHFHAFTDILIPLFVTSQQFNGEVQFLVTDANSNWLAKYQIILKQLSRYEIIDIKGDDKVHCYPSVIVGLKSHKELSIDPSRSPNGYSMTDFTQFLRNSYSLKRETAIKIGDQVDKKPRLLIISRKRTRMFTNEDKIVAMARRLGYEVVVAEAKANLAEFSQIVNSCDVMMGVHGAGLTNLVFLPPNAILIQIVPWGGLEWLATNFFGKPALDMNLRYLEYKIKEEESSLLQQYPLDHAVFRDPLSIHKQNWEAVRSVYLDKQNVKLDVSRFKATLVEALELLHH